MKLKTCLSVLAVDVVLVLGLSGCVSNARDPRAVRVGMSAADAVRLLKRAGATDITESVGVTVVFERDSEDPCAELPSVRWYEMKDGTCVSIYICMDPDFRGVVGGIVTGDQGVPYQGVMSGQQFHSCKHIVVSSNGSVERLQGDVPGFELLED